MITGETRTNQFLRGEENPFSKWTFIEQEHCFPGGRRVIVFREEGKPTGWVSLQSNECLYSISPETVQNILPEACLSSPTLVISDGKSTFKVINPQQRVIWSPTSLSEVFHGCLEPKADGSGDTLAIIEQKNEVREALCPLVKKAIEKGQAALIASLPEPDGSLYLYYITVVNDDMVAASTILGDPQVLNRRLQQKTSLLKSGQFLLVRVSPTGEVSYPPLGEGKVEITADSLSTWRGSDGKLLIPSSTPKDEKKRIIQQLTDDAPSFPPRELQVFDFQRALDEAIAGLPPLLQKYLVDTWFPNACEAKKAITPLPVKNLPTSVRMWVRAASNDEEKRERLAQYQVFKELPNQATDLLRRAGLSWLNSKDEKQMEEILGRLYRNVKEMVSLCRREEIENIFKEKNPGLYAILTQFIQTTKPTDQQLIEFLARERFNQILEHLGRRHFSPDLLDKKVEGVDYEEIFTRAERLLSPQEGLTHPEIVERQVQVLDRYGGVETPYETPYFRQLSNALKAAGYLKEARIPWAAAEGYVRFPKEVRQVVSDFTAALGLASAFVSSLLRNHKELAEEYNLRGEKRQKLEELAEMVKFILNWNVPSYLPLLTPETPALMMPLVLTRPDFCREGREGELRFVATELENSPGGLGMMEVLCPGYGLTSDLPSLFLQFMQNAPLPRDIGKDFSRTQLTILMTDEWSAYRPELEIFRQRMKELGIETAIYSIEELVREKAQISPGFVFHFAYPWNFFKGEEKHFINLLLQPGRVAELLNVPLENILIHNPQEAQRDMDHVMEDADYFFQQNLKIPQGFLETRLPGRVYRENILQMDSKREEYLGKTLPQIGKEISRAMREAAMKIYQGQGKNFLIFNDPWAGLFLYSKMGMAIFHLPYFQKVFPTVLTKFGFSKEQAEKYSQLLQEMTAPTIPLIPPEKISSDSLRQHVAHYLETALTAPENWMVKVSMDPYFGAYDWGSRGNFPGCSMENERVWQAIINRAFTSNVPFVLQRLVRNVPFDQPRKTSAATAIDGLGRTRVGIFHRNPKERVFHPGDLVAAERVLMRYNPFGLVHFGNIRGKVEEYISPGAVTLRSVAEESEFTPVHGSVDAAMVPAVFL